MLVSAASFVGKINSSGSLCVARFCCSGRSGCVANLPEQRPITSSTSSASRPLGSHNSERKVIDAGDFLPLEIQLFINYRLLRMN